MSTYPQVRRADTKTRLDRDTWAGPHLVVTAYDTVGSGEFNTELIEFGTVFEDAPFFAYGVELAENETLVDGDYPFVSCGVSQWEVTKTEEDVAGLNYYLGAYVWVNVVSSKQYRLRFRLSFEGTAMKNVEYFRSTNG